MQNQSTSLDTLKETLLRAVDAEYNVVQAETVLEIISQLEKMQITKDQLHATRLGREINTIRQKIDARKKSAQQGGDHPEAIIEIAQRAKKLLRSWQGLLNTSQTESTSSTVPTTPVSAAPPAPPLLPPPPTPTTPLTNGDSHDSPSETAKPRIILKVKISPAVNPSTTSDVTKTKRKRDSEQHPTNGTVAKRRKPQTPASPMSPVPLIEPSSSLPRLKTTQQMLLEMQLTQPHILSTQSPTVNAILQNQIIDESLNDTSKLDYSALHHGRETTTINTNVQSNNAHYQKQLSTSTVTNTIPISNANVATGSSSKRHPLVRRPSSTLTSMNLSAAGWENGSSGGGSPISPSSSSSSSVTSNTSWPLSNSIPDPPLSVPIVTKKKRRKKSAEIQPTAHIHVEQSTPSSPDLGTLCAPYETVADLVDAHRRRMHAEHDARELEARPQLLLAPLDQLAFVYERETERRRTKEMTLPPNVNVAIATSSSMTAVQTLDQPSGLVALPFIDCPFEFDLVLDELVVQPHPTADV